MIAGLGIERFALVAGGSLGGMITLEVALTRPASVDHVLPIAAPAATGVLLDECTAAHPCDALDRIVDAVTPAAGAVVAVLYRQAVDARYGPKMYDGSGGWGWNGREYADWGIHDFCEVKGIVGYGE
mgnify:CR=1 FL=1